MSLLIKKPQWIIWALIPILWVFAYIADANTIYNKSFIYFTLLDFWPYAAIVLFFTGLGYLLMDKFGRKLLNWAIIGHFGLLGLFLLILFASKWYAVLNPGSQPKVFVPLNKVVVYALPLSYLFYFINIVASFVNTQVKSN